MEIKTIGLASDHAGFALKQFVKTYLEEKGYEYKDYGTYSEESCDYPDFGHALARGMEQGEQLRVLRPQRSNGRRCSRVTGHHNDIGPLVQEEFRNETGAPLNVQGRFFSIRTVGIVREIMIFFPRQHLDELPVYREPAAAGIKYAYRCHWSVPRFRQ